MLSCESGMHVASFQDGTSALPDLEYAKGINKIVVMKFNTTPQCTIVIPALLFIMQIPQWGSFLLIIIVNLFSIVLIIVKEIERFQFVPPNCGIVFHLMLN